eukprot:Rmarinus@m.20044
MSETPICRAGVHITDMPYDVLECIISRVSCEISLLGGVARVNREFREIAFSKQTRESVQKNFLREHPFRCTECFENKDDLRTHLFHSASGGKLPCVIWINLVTAETCVRDAFQEFNDDGFDTFLHFAVTEGHVHIVRYIMEDSGSPDILKMAAMRKTLLHCAVREGHLNLVRYFVEEMDEPELINEIGINDRTVLHEAALCGSMDMIRYLVEERGASDLIYKKSGLGFSVIRYACRGGHFEAVKYFLDERGATDLLDVEDKSFLHDAAGGGSVDLVQYLIEAKGFSALFDATVLQNAACDGSVETVRYLVEHMGGSDMLRGRYAGGTTILHWAAYGEVAVMRYLLEEEGLSDILAETSNDGQTVLHHAAVIGSVDMICYLL